MKIGPDGVLGTGPSADVLGYFRSLPFGGSFLISASSISHLSWQLLELVLRAEAIYGNNLTIRTNGGDFCLLCLFLGRSHRAQILLQHSYR